MASSERSRAKNRRVAALRRSSTDCADMATGRGATVAAGAGFATGTAGLDGCPPVGSGGARRGGAGTGLASEAAGFFAGAFLAGADFLAAAGFLAGLGFLTTAFFTGTTRLAAEAAIAMGRVPALLPLFSLAFLRRLMSVPKSPARPP